MAYIGHVARTAENNYALLTKKLFGFKRDRNKTGGKGVSILNFLPNISREIESRRARLSGHTEFAKNR